MKLLDPSHPIHDPRAHTAAIGIGLLGIVALAGFGGEKISSLPLPAAYSISDEALGALPFGTHDYTIFAGTGSGKFPARLAAAIRKSGDAVQMQDALFMSHSGVAVSPDTPEGHALADAMSKAIDEPVTVANSDGGAFEIGIGPPVESP